MNVVGPPPIIAANDRRDRRIVRSAYSKKLLEFFPNLDDKK